MTAKSPSRRAVSVASNKHEAEQAGKLTTAKRRSRSKTSGRVGRSMSRKEKLAAVRKANQALMKALDLMAHRNGSETDAKGDI